MKKIFLALFLILNCTAAHAAEPAAKAVEETKTMGSLNLPSGKSVKIISHNELDIPVEMQSTFGRTYQIMYETEIPVKETAKLQAEATEILNYLLTKLQGDFKTIYVRANGKYTGKMLIAKNGEDFKFVKNSANRWEIKISQ